MLYSCILGFRPGVLGPESGDPDGRGDGGIGGVQPDRGDLPEKIV